jgi:predicted DNA-binding ribbon-helix-helix protein
MKSDEKIQQSNILLYMPASLKEKINEQAHNERLNMSEFIRRVVSDYINSKNGGDK